MSCNVTGDVAFCPEWTFQSVATIAQCKYHRCVLTHANSTHDLMNCSGVDFKGALFGTPTTQIPTSNTFVGGTNLHFNKVGYNALSWYTHGSVKALTCADEYLTCVYQNGTGLDCNGAIPVHTMRMFVGSLIFGMITMLMIYRLSVRCDMVIIDAIVIPVVLTTILYFFLLAIPNILFVNISTVMIAVAITYGPAYLAIQKYMSNKRVSTINEVELHSTKTQFEDDEEEAEQQEFV